MRIITILCCLFFVLVSCSVSNDHQPVEFKTVYFQGVGVYNDQIVNKRRPIINLLSVNYTLLDNLIVNNSGLKLFNKSNKQVPLSNIVYHDNMITFYPIVDLTPGDKYHLIVHDSVFGESDNKQLYSMYFTVSKDAKSVPLSELISSKEVSSEPIIKLLFTYNVHNVSNMIHLYYYAYSKPYFISVPIEIHHITSMNNLYYIFPSDKLSSNYHYRLLIEPAICNTMNVCGLKQQYSLQVAEDSTFDISLVNMANYSSNVALNQFFVFQSVNINHLEESDITANFPFDFTKISNRQFLIQPKHLLTAFTNYHIEFSKDVLDSHDNHLYGKKFYFTTGLEAKSQLYFLPVPNSGKLELVVLSSYKINQSNIKIQQLFSKDNQDIKHDLPYSLSHITDTISLLKTINTDIGIFDVKIFNGDDLLDSFLFHWSEAHHMHIFKPIVFGNKVQMQDISYDIVNHNNISYIVYVDLEGRLVTYKVNNNNFVHMDNILFNNNYRLSFKSSGVLLTSDDILHLLYLKYTGNTSQQLSYSELSDGNWNTPETSDAFSDMDLYPLIVPSLGGLAFLVQQYGQLQSGYINQYSSELTLDNFISSVSKINYLNRVANSEGIYIYNVYSDTSTLYYSNLINLHNPLTPLDTLENIDREQVQYTTCSDTAICVAMVDKSSHYLQLLYWDINEPYWHNISSNLIRPYITPYTAHYNQLRSFNLLSFNKELYVVAFNNTNNHLKVMKYVGNSIWVNLYDIGYDKRYIDLASIIDSNGVLTVIGIDELNLLPNIIYSGSI